MRGSYGLDKLNWAMLITGGVFTILALVFGKSRALLGFLRYFLRVSGVGLSAYIFKE